MLNNDVVFKNWLVVVFLIIYDLGLDGELMLVVYNFWWNCFWGFGMWIVFFMNVYLSGIGFELFNVFYEENLLILKVYVMIFYE